MICFEYLTVVCEFPFLKIRTNVVRISESLVQPVVEKSRPKICMSFVFFNEKRFKIKFTGEIYKLRPFNIDH